MSETKKSEYRELPSEQIIEIAEACMEERKQNPDAAWLGVTDTEFKDVTIMEHGQTHILVHRLNPYFSGSWLQNVGKSLSLFTKQKQATDDTRGLTSGQSTNTKAGKLTRDNNKALTLINEELKRMYPKALGFIQYEAQSQKLDEPGVRHYIRSFTKVFHLHDSKMTRIVFADLKDWLYPGSLIASKNRYQVSHTEEVTYISSVISELMVRRAKNPPAPSTVVEAFSDFDQSALED
ncbi:MAG: hypothetical protein P4M14_06065 [Gammaproteobacteria bacterium]|nr:hypothetical protein [Gammaproteobacteria bacterium]